jgi:hypothetical protein
LTVPNTYGVPVALCGVPRADALALCELAAVDVLPPDDELLLEDELLPQPATKTAPAATAASTAPVFRSALI